MNEDELRQACEEFLEQDDHVPDISKLLAFARRMQAVGIKKSREEFLGEYHAIMNDDYDFAAWCEQEARRLEGGQ